MNNLYIINGIIIFLFCLIIVTTITHSYSIVYKPSIKYFNKYELSNYLIQDADNFYSSLSLENLKLRNIIDKNTFLSNISKYLYSPNTLEKKIITNAIYKAHNLLKNISIIGFKYKKLKNYKWIIGCSYGQQYEFGYPHTRNDVIILNYNNIYDSDLYKTLIHERIHIYQKLFPDDINDYLNIYNFKKYKKQNNKHLANPDTDNYIYQLNNNICECIITNQNIIQYTNNNFKFEHPYEYMAYDIVELITKKRN